MHVIRTQAQKAYETALATQRAAEQGNDERAYLNARQALNAARSALVAAESAYPLRHETIKASNALRLRNRSLDI